MIASWHAVLRRKMKKEGSGVGPGKGERKVAIDPVGDGRGLTPLSCGEDVA